jgi:hypothetical protein
MRLNKKNQNIISIITLNLALFVFSHGNEWFMSYPKGTLTGTISGKITPGDAQTFIFARQRNSQYGGIARFNSTNGAFTTTPLPSGTYDLAIINIQKPYYTVVGQYIDSNYLGNNLTSKDEQNIKILVNTLSNLQDQACNNKNLKLLSESTIFTKNFINYEEDTSKIGPRPRRISNWAKDPGPIHVTTKRKFWLIGGNQNNAYVICNKVHEVESDIEERTRDKEGKVIGTGHWFHNINNYVYDELVYCEKQNGQWLITAIDSINLNTVEYIHSGPNFWNGYIQYTVSGPLVGIQVNPNKDTPIGEYTLTEVKNPSTNKARPYRFESHEIKK